MYDFSLWFSPPPPSTHIQFNPVFEEKDRWGKVQAISAEEAFGNWSLLLWNISHESQNGSETPGNENGMKWKLSVCGRVPAKVWGRMVHGTLGKEGGGGEMPELSRDQVHVQEWWKMRLEKETEAMPWPLTKGLPHPFIRPFSSDNNILFHSKGNPFSLPFYAHRNQGSEKGSVFLKVKNVVSSNDKSNGAKC